MKTVLQEVEEVFITTESNTEQRYKEFERG